MSILKAGRPSASDEAKAKSLAMLTEQTEESRRLNVNVPKSKYLAFKAKALANEESMSDAVLSFIDEYLSK